MRPVISFKNFSFKYRTQSEPTLKQINLDILHGEKIWIAGPSGSGKSTLAHCLNGLIPFSYSGEISGSLLFEEKDISKDDIFERSRRVGTILQNPDAQFVGLTVGEDVAFQMENEQIAQDEMRIKVVNSLELVGMLAYESQGPHELSGGQKQSVSLAGVLTTKADILLFDEPLANLDPESGVRAMQLIEDIHRTGGKTTIIIEHRVEDVLAQPVDRVVVMNEGEIVAIGEPDQLLRDGTFMNYGLRQSLYLSALDYAGVSLDELEGLSSPEQLRIRQGYDQEAVVVKLEEWTNSESPPMEPPTCELTVPTAPLLELRNLRFSYSRELEAIKGVSLKIGKGERVALLGNNGAGKSTLSGLITGILKPQSGDILLQGSSIMKWSIRRRAEVIGYVMQNPNHMITRHLIADEVGIGLRARGIGAAEQKERIEDALRICGLYPYRNWPVTALSFGQKKRLTIASILALSPQLMILDEPTAGQDYRHYTEFMNFMDTLSEQGMSFLFITHDMHLALEYADRAVVLSGGDIIAEDRVAQVLSNPAVTSKANLRETSLSRFARAWNLSSPTRFTERFVAVERQGAHAHE